MPIFFRLTVCREVFGRLGLSESELLLHKGEEMGRASGPFVAKFRCSICGLVLRSGVDMQIHLRSHEGHLSAASLRIYRRAQTEPEQRASSKPSAQMRALVLQDEAVLKAPSIHTIVLKIRFLHGLLEHVCFLCPVQTNDRRRWLRGGFLAVHDFMAFAVAFIGASLWRTLPEFWRAYFSWTLAGCHDGCCLVTPFRLREHAEGLRRRPRHLALSAAEAVLSGVLHAQAYFRKRFFRFDQVVRDSHGTHMPLSVREAVCVMWWLPELLQVGDLPRIDDWEHLRTLGELQADMALLSPVLSWASRMLPMFRWPSQDSVYFQYLLLVRTWRARLREDVELQGLVWERSRGTTTFSWPLVSNSRLTLL